MEDFSEDEDDAQNKKKHGVKVSKAKPVKPKVPVPTPKRPASSLPSPGETLLDTDHLDALDYNFETAA